MHIRIQDEILKIHSLGLLDKLLIDKTTKANIIWATDAYCVLGADYQREKEIRSVFITGNCSGIIKNRTGKALEQQSKRTRQHAEVFTPLWICNKMNNHVDEVWFGRPDVFNVAGVPTEKVIFPAEKNWKEYVDSRRLEITCGEAPYLVSRYDVSTGENIEIKNRIGILDRKLRVVSENTGSEKEWLQWAVRAFQATYGYEFQGDNLLIARVNLLMTFEEYLFARWKRKPNQKEYQVLANIIVWNIWQMDGLTGTIPYCKTEGEYQQITVFDWLGLDERKEQENIQPRCRIYDWRRNNSLEYLKINKGRK
ncbi:restriction endonuclease subunit M [Lachnospiraceae bacterium 62-35]